ncbi:uncharacterized protein LOC144350822 [Saccoglossus kowalevskii]
MAVISKNAEKFYQLGVKKILQIDSIYECYIREDCDSVYPYDDDSLHGLLYPPLLDIKQIIRERNTRLSTDDQCILLKNQIDTKDKEIMQKKLRLIEGLQYEDKMAKVVGNLQIDKSNLEKTMSLQIAKIEELEEILQNEKLADFTNRLAKSKDQNSKLRNELHMKNEALEQLERHLSEPQQYDEKTTKTITSLQFDKANLQQTVSSQVVKKQKLEETKLKMEEQINDLKYQLSKAEVENTELHNKFHATVEKTTDTNKEVDSDKYGRDEGGRKRGKLQKERTSKIPL